jgi:uncharacterized cupin superfamily protein
MSAVLQELPPPIALLSRGADVAPIVAALERHPKLWNEHRQRLAMYPHAGVADIWVRYNPIENYAGDMEAFNAEHESEWYYPAADLLGVKPLVFAMMHAFGGVQLGGVLITRIPPGGEVRPHVDRGWHASYYDKIAVSLKADERQRFCFDDAELVTRTGDVFTFDNSRRHWVINESDAERMTLIVCIRRSR